MIPTTLLQTDTVEFLVKGSTTTDDDFGTTKPAQSVSAQVYLKVKGDRNVPDRPKGVSPTAKRVRLYLLGPLTDDVLLNVKLTCSRGFVWLEHRQRFQSHVADDLLGRWFEGWWWQ